MPQKGPHLLKSLATASKKPQQTVLASPRTEQAEEAPADGVGLSEAQAEDALETGVPKHGAGRREKETLALEE
ncbi:hypothetical protein GGTG_04656 [Gaeumannomyces tritici R3-111a-1]|uniref:Uncharacterized protein n=1 Tax=Gaeumannomyces tritici (strain R3-111a-1) TaxID=644352 RepID=J3NTQ6_GAET3|nr:hypothetical protein GGTG_04656 [Gaeumannomyces tritici R3-111a-1]EJT79571.1 hypothetical protein GGTG_04656 [Gaeumannomyces tritici R3-111a-1]